VTFDPGINEGGAATGAIELTTLTERQFRGMRRNMQLVFQDPHASLNPAMDLATAVAHPLLIHGVTKNKDEIDRRVREAFERVGLAPVDQYLHKFPADLSGGQKQRAVLARAIMLRPALLVADEPVSMLDMSVRAKILELMLELRDDLGLSYLYVTHDLATAKFFCDTIAIMYLGRIVEIGPAEQIYADPKHPYTKALLAAIPEPDPRRALPRDLPRGEIPDAAVPPLGCSFHPRCPKAFAPCGWEGRDVRSLLEQRWVAVPEEQYERERESIGDLTSMPAAAGVTKVPDGPRGTAAALLDQVMSDDPAEPFWRGVVKMDYVAGAARVTFREPVEPLLLDIGDVRVACHLHDPRFADQAPPH
jgi:oligopeptide/dipeptide ABC transporter ATP-binding protein